MKHANHDLADDVFVREMANVQPLAHPAKAQRKKIRTRRILPDIQHQPQGNNPSTSRKGQMIQRTDTWLLQADGVSNKEIRELSKAVISHDLDLHGCTQAQAIQSLSIFISKAISHHIHKVCIVHGKGNHSEGKCVLKDTTYHWFEHGECSSYILAATPALQSKGGACNVLLRK